MNTLKHGGDIIGFAKKSGCSVEHVMDFSSNINPLGVSSKLKRIYQESVLDLAKYPDPHAQTMCQHIAARHRLDVSNVIAGNGSIALIELAIRCLRPKRALLLEPCFNEYRRLLDLSNVSTEHIVLTPEKDFQFPYEEILKKLSEVDLLIIGHPNNPTGLSLSAEKLKHLMDKAGSEGKYILIDEAFIDWCEDSSMIRYVQSCSSPIVVRSLTKFYALAGIRAGYACACKEMIDQMRTFQETWGCNNIAQNLTIAALCDQEFQIKSRKWFDEESKFMWESLKRIPSIKVFPSQANFFLCQIMNPSIKDHFWQKMTRLGVYLREVGDFISLDRSYFRLALKKRAENLFLLRVIQESLQSSVKNHDRNILSVHS